ncbi:10903_t:CDS:2 [Racocetra persica]|uniref:10903_t:CDS:1 n=1 Tax=Racocetra persica TaxID=160502 RepID=A0ACA9QKS7_9GLOM|nr:10903_t:CDS:2 [Racocetra persica]
MNEEKNIYPASYLDRLNNLITNQFNHLCPIKKDFRLTLSGISRLVMLDRYSQKDKERKTLQIGDIVLTVIKPDPKFPSREIEEEFAANIDPDLLYQEHPRQIIKPDFAVEKPLELYYEQIA